MVEVFNEPDIRQRVEDFEIYDGHEYETIDEAGAAKQSHCRGELKVSDIFPKIIECLLYLESSNRRAFKKGTHSLDFPIKNRMT